MAKLSLPTTCSPYVVQDPEVLSRRLLTCMLPRLVSTHFLLLCNYHLTTPPHHSDVICINIFHFSKLDSKISTNSIKSHTSTKSEGIPSLCRSEIKYNKKFSPMVFSFPFFFLLLFNSDVCSHFLFFVFVVFQRGGGDCLKHKLMTSCASLTSMTSMGVERLMLKSSRFVLSSFFYILFFLFVYVLFLFFIYISSCIRILF